MKNLENRSLTSEFEVRNEEGKPTVVEGYAARFDEETVIGGAFVEKLSRSAFDGTDMANTVALFNHDMNMPLARAGFGLDLEVDEQGLKYRFELGEQSYAKDLAENIKRGIVSTSSFGFTVKEDSWEKRDGLNVRTLESVDVLFDVSPTTQGAYPTTEVGLRSMEAALSPSEEAAISELDAEPVEEAPVAEESTDEVAEAIIEAIDETAEVEEESEERAYDAPESEEDEEEEKEERAEEDETIENVTESEDGPSEEEEETTERAQETSPTMENTNSAPAVVQSLGDNTNELRGKFNLAKAVKEAVNGQVTGLEAEAAQEAALEARNAGIAFMGQIGIPSEFRADAAAMSVGAAGTQTSEGIFDDGQSFVRNFRPSTVAERLGATYFRNATGNIVIPVQNDNIDPQELNELADVDLTNVGFSQVSIAPQRVAAGTSFSKQLLAQTSDDLERFIMADLNREMSLKMDKHIVDVLEAGLSYTDDSAGAYSGGASAADFAELAAMMEMDLRVANVDPATAKFLLDPASLRKFKRAALDSGSGMFAGNDTNIYGYGVVTTNQTTAGNVVLGDFRDLCVAEWGGLDIIVDPYTGAQKNEVKIVANSHLGAVVRRPGAFKAVATV